jgi:hypothetical protein
MPAGEIEERTRAIYQSVVSQSDYITTGNFRRVHAEDIERLFDLYDASFFDGSCRQLVDSVPLRFRLSKRMTKSAGKTAVRQLRDRRAKSLGRSCWKTNTARSTQTVGD